MKAIILAAGVGTRMGKISEDLPKCLLEINGTPIIRKQVESLNANGINDISVVVGYREDMVKKVCKDLNIKFYTNPKYKETGMFESMFCAEEELKGEFIMIYGDIYFEETVIEKLLQDRNDFCMVVDKSKDIEHEAEEVHEEYHGEKIKKGSTKVNLVDGLVKKISKSLSPEEASAEYIGITKFSKSGTRIIFERIKHLIDSGEIAKYPSPSYLIRWLIEQGEKINVIFVEEREYAEIDYAKDLKEAKDRFEK